MEIRYQNTVEGSVQFLADAVCSTERYKRSIARRSWILFFVLLICSVALLNQALERGVAVLVISTDFEEIAHICNRALVFNRGRVSGELLNEQVTFANLLHLACADEVPEKATSDINPLATA